MGSWLLRWEFHTSVAVLLVATQVGSLAFQSFSLKWTAGLELWRAAEVLCPAPLGDARHAFDDQPRGSLCIH